MSAQEMGLMDFVKAAKAEINEIDPAQLEAMRSERPELMVVDVREGSEHEQGHIEGAMLIPRGIIEAAADWEYPKRVEKFCEARDKPVVVYCATGGRSAMAVATLQKMGYQEIYSLAGGMVQWEKENRPLVREARYV